MLEETKLPSIEELGEEFLASLNASDEAFEFFHNHASEILENITEDKALEFINENGVLELIDEDNSIKEAFENALFCLYSSQEELNYEDFFKDLVKNYFKL